MKIDKTLLLLLLFVSATYSKAQISSGGLPYSITAEKQKSAGRTALTTKIVSYQTVNNQLELNRAKKISEECKYCDKEYYGSGIDASINLIRDGQKHSLGDEGTLWLLKVSSQSAFGLQLFFNKYKLPEGAKLYLYNEDKSIVLGAFTSQNNRDDYKFTTQILPGEVITLEYFEPKNVPFQGELEIYRVVHAFKEMYANRQGGYGASGSCNIDINCSDGNGYQDVKKAVARIMIYDDAFNLTYQCSGALINTTSTIRQNLILTANHCVTYHQYVGSPDLLEHDVSEWVFEFGYEIADCNNKTVPQGLPKSMNGASILSRGTLSDYALLDLQAEVPLAHDVVYLGWDKSGNGVSKGIGIHHPQGDVKKISIDTDPLTKVRTEIASSGNFNEVQGVPTDWRVVWNKGVTEYGSSGSPLFSHDKKVIGQLRGGKSNCATAVYGPDYYGMLSVSWANPDAPYPTLGYWLDKNNTGATSLSTYTPAAASTFTINSLNLTDDLWENGPKLFAQISTPGSVSALTYRWSPAADFFDPNAAVGLLTFGGNKPALPLTKTYTLIVNNGTSTTVSRQITVTLYDCANKEIFQEVCSSKSTTLGYSAKTGETYSWSPATYLSSSSVSNPVFTPPNTGNFTYTLTASSNKCVRTETYRLSALAPPVAVTFAPRKTGEYIYGGTNTDGLHRIVNNNGVVTVIGAGIHSPTSGDHINERYDPFNNGIPGNSAHAFAITLNGSYQYNSSFGIYLQAGIAGKVLSIPNNGYYFMDSYNLRRTDLQGNVLWNYQSSGSTYYNVVVNPDQSTFLTTAGSGRNLGIWRINANGVKLNSYSTTRDLVDTNLDNVFYND